MTTIIFCIVAVILTILIIITMSRLGKLNNYYSDLLNKLMETQGDVTKHEQRLNAHFRDIANNQKSINDIKSGDVFAIRKTIRDHENQIGKIADIVYAPQKVENEGNESATTDSTTEEAAAEDDKPAYRDRAERAPYPEEVRKMAENLIKAEYGKSSYRVMSNLLQIPVTTVKRWTKQLIQKGELTPKQVAAAEHAE